MYHASDEYAVCRGCGKRLNGKPFWAGGFAYDPQTKKEAKTCFYGGYVCSKSCDYKASLELEQTMPGHGYEQKRVIPSTASAIERKWDQA